MERERDKELGNSKPRFFNFLIFEEIEKQRQEEGRARSSTEKGKARKNRRRKIDEREVWEEKDSKRSHFSHTKSLNICA